MQKSKWDAMKRIALMVVAVMLFCLMGGTMAACGPTTIELDKTTLALCVGDVERLKATVSDEEAEVVWTSSDEEVVTVRNGTVTARSVGSATITAAVGEASATCEVTVTTRTVTLSEEAITLDCHTSETKTLTATVSDGRKVSWSSSNSSVATVSGGTVTGVKPGTAVITATAGTASAECTVTVIDSSRDPSYYILTSSQNAGCIADPGTWYMFMDGGLGASSFVEEPYYEKNSVGVTFTSSASSSAIGNLYFRYQPDATSDGKALQVGDTYTAELDVTMSHAGTIRLSMGSTDGGTKSYTMSIAANEKTHVAWTCTLGDTVPFTITARDVKTDGEKDFVFLCENITFSDGELPVLALNQSRMTLNLSGAKTGQLSATLDGALAENISWSSADEAVATVSDSGQVTAVGVGSTVVRATNGRVSATCQVEVIDEDRDPSYYILESKRNADCVASPGTWYMFMDGGLGASSFVEEPYYESNSVGTTFKSTASSSAVGNLYFRYQPDQASDGQPLAIGDAYTMEFDVTMSYAGRLSMSMNSSAFEETQTFSQNVAANEKTHISWTCSVGDTMPLSISVKDSTVDGAADFVFLCENITFTKEALPVLSIDPANLALDLNGTATGQLSATLDGEPAQGVVWTSSDETVATVSDSGLVTAVAVGNATIKATVSGNIQATCAVTVSDTALVEYELQKGNNAACVASPGTWFMALNNGLSDGRLAATPAYDNGSISVTFTSDMAASKMTDFQLRYQPAETSDGEALAAGDRITIEFDVTMNYAGDIGVNIGGAGSQLKTVEAGTVTHVSFTGTLSATTPISIMVKSVVDYTEGGEQLTFTVSNFTFAKTAA